MDGVILQKFYRVGPQLGECVDSGASAVNDRGNTRENQADTIVVHSDLIGEL